MKKESGQKIKQRNKVTIITQQPFAEVDNCNAKANSENQINSQYTHSKRAQMDQVIVCQKYHLQQKRLKQVSKKSANTGITIAKAKKQLNKPLSVIDPGPTSYYNNVINKAHQSIKFTKSKGHETVLKREQIKVGPGSYNIECSKRPANFQYQLGSKYESYFDAKISKNPGPGEYQIVLPQILLQKSRKSSHDKGFGSSNRFQVQKVLPGPGSYDVSVKDNPSLNKKRTISNGNRMSLHKLEQVPGPGNYEILSSFACLLKRNKGISIGIRNQNYKGQAQLTAEAYNKYSVKIESQSQYQSPPSFSIGNERRKFIQIKNTPSPQDYKVKIPYPQSSSTKIGRAQLNCTSTKLVWPGPGSYLQSKQQNTIKYTFAKSKSLSLLNPHQNGPSVGNYNVGQEMAKKQNKNLNFCKSKRLEGYMKKSIQNMKALKQMKIAKIRI